MMVILGQSGFTKFSAHAEDYFSPSQFGDWILGEGVWEDIKLSNVVAFVSLLRVTLPASFSWTQSHPCCT